MAERTASLAARVSRRESGLVWGLALELAAGSASWRCIHAAPSLLHPLFPLSIPMLPVSFP